MRPIGPPSSGFQITDGFTIGPVQDVPPPVIELCDCNTKTSDVPPVNPVVQHSYAPYVLGGATLLLVLWWIR